MYQFYRSDRESFTIPKTTAFPNQPDEAEKETQIKRLRDIVDPITGTPSAGLVLVELIEWSPLFYFLVITTLTLPLEPYRNRLSLRAN